MLLQNLLVALIVVAAALFAAWRLPGAATRLRFIDALVARAGGGEGHLAALLKRWQLRHRQAMVGSGCGACGSNPALKKAGLRQKH